jgi:flagellar basal-body rod modification protein FlgD
MSIQATAPASGGSDALVRADKKGILGKDDFLQLLVAQLKHQDPMKPMEDKEFMAQMAQFSQLEQVTNMASALERLSFSGQAAQSLGLIGRTVEWRTAAGETQSGVVDRVRFDEGVIHVHVGESDLSPDDIRSVR